MAREEDFKNLKTMLSIDEDDTSHDTRLNQILSMESNRLKNKLHRKASEDVPDELNYILIEVSIRRFNLLKNEGMTGYSQEGENFTFEDDEFDDFLDDIENWLADQENRPTSLGKVSFISGYSGR
ncbi:hypothetical protein GBP19_04030 [Pediococcus acidilactici]|uniref:phage head-tail connector protein n=1 Tax=Pediococcus acidilactici TaxID=1254 RepID=UPI00132FDC77|nr:phage head-tail connector protein [Pediococcus acidilactici]KAF0500076.1 hypothetical protein GBP19_04030 [Pediococcus acidilactici]